jgi:ribonuclease HI
VDFEVGSSKALMMAKKKPKFYVVWRGKNIGIFNSWDDCQKQINGVAGARYMSFESLAQAEYALKNEKEIKAKRAASQPDKPGRFYVIWSGHRPGIFESWDEAKKQIDGFPRPKYQTFGSRAMAEKAWLDGPEAFAGKNFKKVTDISPRDLEKIGKPIALSLAVDAACNGRTGEFEYRGVLTETGTEVFRAGPFPDGSNNVGEFLAIVHGLAYLQKIGSDMPIYSDSRNAMAWVKMKKSKSWVKNQKTQDLMTRGENWLKSNTYRNHILKWETKYWGEIPADFGRK